MPLLLCVSPRLVAACQGRLGVELNHPTLTRRTFAHPLTYPGGYLLPGSPPPDPPVAVCQDLPDDLEQAAVEQIAFWFQHRDKLGLKISWPSGAEYKQFAVQDLLPGVQATLQQYRRLIL